MVNPKIEKLPKQARVMLLGIALSALGNGLVLPYTFIYFHNIRGFPIAVAGLIASYGAFSSLAISPLVGNLIDKWGPKPVLITSLLVSFVGYCSLSQVKTITSFDVVIESRKFISGVTPIPSPVGTVKYPSSITNGVVISCLK